MMLKSIISILKWLCGCNLKHCVYCEVTGEKCRKTSWRGGGPGGRRKKRTQNPVSCSERSAAVPSSACMLSHFSRVRLFVTPWTVAHQAPLSMGFFRQEYWSGLPFPPPGGLPDPGVEAASLMSPALAGRCFSTSTTWEAHIYIPIYPLLWISFPFSTK